MKALVVLFQHFSMQEISCATEIIAMTGNQIDTCALHKDAVPTEDHFKVLPDYGLDEVNLAQYDCVILPGIAYMFDELKQQEYASFLSQLKHHPHIVIAAISSSPALLGAAGLLDHHTYCGGLYQEVVEYLPFMPKENFVHEAIHQDGNLITAVGFAYREFAFKIAEHFQLEVDPSYFGPLESDFSHIELSWTMSPEVLAIWNEALPDIRQAYSPAAK